MDVNCASLHALCMNYVIEFVNRYFGFGDFKTWVAPLIGMVPYQLARLCGLDYGNGIYCVNIIVFTKWQWLLSLLCMC